MSHILAHILNFQSFMQARPLMKIFISPHHHLWVNDIWDFSKNLTPENLSTDLLFIITFLKSMRKTIEFR